jgi:hypothetical protein
VRLAGGGYERLWATKTRWIRTSTPGELMGSQMAERGGQKHAPPSPPSSGNRERVLALLDERGRGSAKAPRVWWRGVCGGVRSGRGQRWVFIAREGSGEWGGRWQ